jgi:ubiquinone/menaquinone biosynthesis C-methylase UbiE
MEPDNIHAFACVDQAGDPNSLVRFLETAATRYFGPLNAKSFALLRVASGAHVLDVGCGTGDDVAILSTLVGHEGQVVGIDSSQAMLSEAIRRTTNASLPIQFYLGDAQSLAFADASFDAVRSSRLLCHVSEPQVALAEMIRVLRAGRMSGGHRTRP